MALPRFYEDKVFDTSELKAERAREKVEYTKVSESDIGAMQREKNIKARVKLYRKETNFEQVYKDFKNSGLLVDCGDAGN